MIRTFNLPIGVDELTVSFHPDRLIAVQRQLAEFAATEPPQFERLIAILVEILESWDLTEGGMPVPITYANLERLPAQFLVDLVLACGASIR